jgi:hypothetical protein
MTTVSSRKPRCAPRQAWTQPKISTSLGVRAGAWNGDTRISCCGAPHQPAHQSRL